MLVKILSNEREFLIVLRHSTYEEFLSKTKKILNIDQSRVILVKFSGCNVTEDIFNEVLQSFGENKELVSFEIDTDIASTVIESPNSEEYTQIDYVLSEFEDNKEALCNDQTTNEVLDIHAPGTSQQLYHSVVQPTNAVVTNVQIIDRRLIINPQIVSLNIGGIFEVGKMMGMIRSGLPLENKHRIEVAKAVVKKILEILGFDYLIQTVDFQYLSQKLETLLNDPTGIYYIPAVGGCPARGILLHVFYSQRTSLARSSVIVRRKKIRRLPIDTELTAEGNLDYQDVVREFEEMDGDWNDLVNLWESTRRVRLEMWQSKSSGLKISDIFESFPFLIADGRADALIRKDFESLFPSAKASFLAWDQNYKKVLNQARRFRDDYAKNLISQIDFMENEEDKMVSSLILIPYIMPPNGRRTLSGEAATKNDIQESFISIYDDMDACNSEDGKDIEYNLRFLRDNSVITYACYSIENNRFKYDDPITAFLGLFTKMVVFNMKFPKLCNHVWQFIQQGIFGIRVENSIMCHTTQVALKLLNL